MTDAGGRVIRGPTARAAEAVLPRRSGLWVLIAGDGRDHGVLAPQVSAAAHPSGLTTVRNQ